MFPNQATPPVHNFQSRIIGQTPAMRGLKNLIARIAPSSVPVLISGETGTGKELAAHELHLKSKRNGRFVSFNCSGLPLDILRSELFGHVRGSFTGANQDRTGRFLAANNGTLFLDEIGDMPNILQASILRAIEYGEIEVIGESIPRTVNVRILCATNKDLEEMVKKNEFRTDLYHRISPIRIILPPLRDRIEDVPLLVAHFLETYQVHNGVKLDLAPPALEIILELVKGMDGNVRQLKQLIEVAAIFAAEGRIMENNPAFHQNSSLSLLQFASPVAPTGLAEDAAVLPAAHLSEQTLRDIIRQANPFKVSLKWKKISMGIEIVARCLGIDRGILTNFLNSQQLGLRCVIEEERKKLLQQSLDEHWNTTEIPIKVGVPLTYYYAALGDYNLKK